MATESELRDLLKGPEPEGRTAIDLDAVLTRARRRRRPKLLAVQALGSVAVVGGLFAAVVATLPPQQQAASILAEDTAGGSGFSMPESADENELRLGPDACGAPLETPDDPAWTLTLAAFDGTRDAASTVIELRSVDESLPSEFSTSLGSLTLARDGIVVGHGTLTEAQATSDEDPGFGVDWTATYTFEACDPGASLEPSTYEVRAVMEVFDDATATRTVVLGIPSTVEIR